MGDRFAGIGLQDGPVGLTEDGMMLQGVVTKLFQFQGIDWIEIEVDRMQGSISMPNEGIDWRQPELRYSVGDHVHVDVTPRWDAYTPDERLFARENRRHQQ